MMTTNSYPNAAANMLTSAPWGSWDLLKEEEGKVLPLFLAQLHLSSPSAKYLLRATALDWCCQPKQLFNQGNSGQYFHHHHHHQHHHHLQGGDMSFALNLVTAAIPPPLLRLQSSLVHHRLSRHYRLSRQIQKSSLAISPSSPSLVSFTNPLAAGSGLVERTPKQVLPPPISYRFGSPKSAQKSTQKSTQKTQNFTYSKKDSKK